MSENQLNISKYFDSTFLKTSVELGISNKELESLLVSFINEAIEYDFKCVMIRPNFISLAKKIKEERRSKINIGTVIDFPLGDSSTNNKLKEAKDAFKKGAKELDFVCDYNLFKTGNYDVFDETIYKCSSFAIKNKLIVKWIIETGALSREEIRLISKRIYDIVIKNFSNNISKVFIKTSTGYYGGFGATIADLKAIKSVVGDMPIKASGGISDSSICKEMIDLGVIRVGTSKALSIYKEFNQ